MFDIIIIGAGVSGLFAGAFVKKGLKTIIIEKKHNPGLKLLISGSSQCNITSKIPNSQFISKYGKNGKFLIPSFNLFNNLDLIRFLKDNNIKLEFQEDKVFPKSRNSSDILNFLLKEISKKNIDIRSDCEVKNIFKNEEIWNIEINREEVLKAKNIIVCTGGCSYPKTGSDGMFFNILKKIGLNIINLEPALTSVDIKEHYLGDFSGFSFKNAEITILRNKKKILKKSGDLLITHTGFSGPVILNNSRNIQNGDVIKLNIIGKNQEQIKLFLKNYNKKIKDLLNEFGFSKSLTNYFIQNYKTLQFPDKVQYSSLKTIQTLIFILGELEFIVEKKQGFNKAMITKGGVCLKDINPQTMEAKNFKNLYFAGEVIDIDGETGGYNIQAAVSTAYNAVLNICSDD
ncbi:MAG: aminoacetone oxidase family FAD-binding enzyme [Candidatus Muirbacterium halophilum]|nr:aminoacetone oxidase family FAD-binding enzyme [Candidatus Muirbacterium halophilum]MCK9476091.1 aminoacetone oxidase family FAD-binding enzyme [Candidatus Muirbacterium halophilum]